MMRHELEDQSGIPFESIASANPSYDERVNYKLEGKKQILLSQILTSELGEIKCQMNEIRRSIRIEQDNKLHQRISRKDSLTKPHQCNWCQHTYSSKAALKQHMKLKHAYEQTPVTQPIDRKQSLQFELLPQFGI